MRAFLIIALFGILFLTSCARAPSAPSVYGARGIRVGEIRMASDTGAVLFDVYGQEVGSVRGSVVRDANGARMGRVVAGSGSFSVQDEKGREVGSLTNGGDCYGSDERFLGRIASAVDPAVAGGACLLLLVDRK